MLQSSGPIRFSEVNTELGRQPGARMSIGDAETGVYIALNTSRVKRPSPLRPAKLSEWYEYCQTCGVAWAPAEPYCITNQQCSPGYTATPDGLRCVKQESIAATPPTGLGGSAGFTAKIQDYQWNNGGALIFDPGFGSDGNGTSTLVTTPHLWVNGNAPFDITTRNMIDSRMNAAGIWGFTPIPVGEWVGFSRKFYSAAAKTVYIGMSADNKFKFTLNGALIVNAENIQGYDNFRHWNIYPVNLRSGDNYIEMYALNTGGPAGFAAEVYDMTKAQLIAAATPADLTKLFSTADMVGQAFDLGTTTGWSCPETGGWYLVNNGGVYSCSRELTEDKILNYTGERAFAKRIRLNGQQPDGYSEPNTNGSGLGPYFPPITDTITCPPLVNSSS